MMTVSLILLIGSLICLIVIVCNLWVLHRNFDRMQRLWERAREYESERLK